MNNSTQNLNVFGWNWTFLGDIKLTTDNEGNVSIANSGIQSLLPQQLPGTTLYGTDKQGLEAKQSSDRIRNFFLNLSQMVFISNNLYKKRSHPLDCFHHSSFII